MTRRYPLMGALSLALCAQQSYSSAASRASESANKNLSLLQRGDQSRRKLFRPDHPCVLVRVEVEYAPGEASIVDERGNIVQCELIAGDIDKADGRYFVPIVGIEDSSFDDIESGVSTFVAEGAVLFDGSLQVPQGASFEMGLIDEYIDKSNDGNLSRWRRLRSPQNDRNLGAFGTKKVVVVRADAWDSSTTANMATLSDDVFGTIRDTANLVTQYDQCSHGQITFEPYDNRSGVIEVNLNGNVIGADKFNVQSAMEIAATNVLGNLAAFDHVMLCIPPGTGNWIAYAYVKSWLSVFNDSWCQQMSTQVHEIGHNLNMAHAGRGDDPYGDKSGMMGYSFKEDDTPLQCFNPAKSYKLGWYKGSMVEWDPITQGTWFGNIVGIDDYDGSKAVIVKILRPRNGEHLYIGYNRKKGRNSGVVDEGDRLVIVAEKDGYETSKFVKGLHPTDSGTISKKIFYNFENTQKNLVIEFRKYGNNNINKASVAIYFSNCVYPNCCNGELCKAPSPTKSPTRPSTPPTKSPATAPTRNTSLDVIPSPILNEILANPTTDGGQYFEIYNPHTSAVQLGGYKICTRNGRNNRPKCNSFGNFKLEPGEYYMLCQSKTSIPNSRTCHQEGSFRIRKTRRQVVTLVLRENNRNDTVDRITVPAPRLKPGKAYARKGGRWLDFCGDNCWQWTRPESASFEGRMLPVDSELIPPDDVHVLPKIFGPKEHRHQARLMKKSAKSVKVVKSSKQG